MDIRDVSRKTVDGLEVDVLVSPRSNRSGPEGYDEWRKRMVIRVKAPPLDGRANKEVEDIMNGITGMRCEITVGHMSRQKTVLIRGDPDAAALFLGENV